MMKKITIKSSIILLLMMIPFLQSFTPENSKVASAAISWASLSYDFGSITQGNPVTHEFEFKNEGEAPLLISNVKASCGCTVASFPEDPILPGQSEMIKVSYNAAKTGTFKKTVTVTSNAINPSYELIISGEVMASK